MNSDQVYTQPLLESVGQGGKNLENKLEPSYFHSEDCHYLPKIGELFKCHDPD